MITEEKWLEAIKAWEHIKAQAEIDIEQADLYIQSINKKIMEMKKDGK